MHIQDFFRSALTEIFFIGFFRDFSPHFRRQRRSACSVHLMLLIYEPVLKTILINVSLKAIKLTFFLVRTALDPKYGAESCLSRNLLRFHSHACLSLPRRLCNRNTTFPPRMRDASFLRTALSSREIFYAS